jgi:gamma-glutamyl-gamma-aminobutyrate hydrolase PuuD
MNKSIVFLTAGLLFVASCTIECQTRIAVSKSSASYEAWLRHADSKVVIADMYPLGIGSSLRVLPSCSGLLLTGGEDVYPGKYGKLNELSHCEEIDRYRDSLEFALIEKAITLKIPIFGICRGEQILNVALGGTLYTDIPTDIDTAVMHRCPPGSSGCLHSVTIDPGSLLFRITGKRSGIVNSSHHQAVETTGPGVKVTARAANDVIEAIEKEGPDHGPLIMGVQWHPERLEQNPDLSYPLAVYFLKQAAGRKE